MNSRIAKLVCVKENLSDCLTGSRFDGCRWKTIDVCGESRSPFIEFNRFRLTPSLRYHQTWKISYAKIQTALLKYRLNRDQDLMLRSEW